MQDIKRKKEIVVIGGAGYVGSHTVKKLNEYGYKVSVIDDLSTGHQWAVSKVNKIDIQNGKDLSAFFAGKKVDSIFHFAAKSLVGESISEPLLYYRSNLTGIFNILECMIENDIPTIVFSSTAAVFGDPKTNKLTELDDKSPINPYGKSKLMIEQILHDAYEAYGISSVSLRYFNAAGADPSAQIGEAHSPETHLIPNIINNALLDNDHKIQIFGKDYPTKDGTCVRDYVHVNDLAKAHINGLQYLEKSKGAFQFNLGNENGFSNLEIIECIESELGRKIKFQFGPKRLGDPAILVSDSKHARENLGWTTEESEITNIIKDAVNWHRNYLELSKKF